MGRPLTMYAIPTFGTVDVEWARAKGSIAQELGSSVAEFYDRSPLNIAEKRNNLVGRAQQIGAKSIFFIGDDVCVPPNALMKMLGAWRRGAKIITGIYWTKGAPSIPYIFRDFLGGAYYDWHVGEFFKIDWAGCDCLFIDIEVFKQLEPPYFSLDYTFSDHPENIAEQAQRRGTEDLYFFTKTREAGIQTWCDSSIQCGHMDRETGILYDLPRDLPQAIKGSVIPRKNDLLVADIACGRRTIVYDMTSDVVRFDINEAVNPDVRCDIRDIPEPDNKYDVSFASHVLEHLPPGDTINAILEWTRILKPGGLLDLRVPNIMWAAQKLISNDYSPYMQIFIYGMQDQPHQQHLNGFTVDALRNACELAGNLKIESIELCPNPEPEAEIRLKARKIKKSGKPSLVRSWEDREYLQDYKNKEAENGNSKH